MALKNWKKLTNATWLARWKNQKTKQIIALDDDFLFVKGGGNIGRFVFVKSTPYGDKTVRRFKTKSEAMKFARNYMKKH